MKTSSPLPRRLERGALTVHEARAAGSSEKRLRGPDVHRAFHGVVSTRASATLAERCADYTARIPPTGFFSGCTAAALHGVPLPGVAESSRALHVSVASPQRAPRGRGIVGHSVIVGVGDVVVRNGLPMSSVERTWCELASVLPTEDLVVAGDHLVRRREPLTTVERLRATTRRYPGRRRRGDLMRSLELLDPFAESPQESRLRLRLSTGGIVGFHANRAIATASGRHYRGDLVFAAEGVILEYQGDHHRDPQQFRRDLSRQLDLQADGWVVVLLGPNDIADPGLVRRVRAILTAASVTKPRRLPTPQSSLRSSAQAVSS